MRWSIWRENPLLRSVGQLRIDSCRASRLETTRQLVKAIAARETPEGARERFGDRFLRHQFGSDRNRVPQVTILASLCQRWEAAAAEVPSAVRQVTLRIGIVLAADGGALGKCCRCSARVLAVRSAAAGSG